MEKNSDTRSTKCNEIIKRMASNGDLPDIITGLTHTSALVRMNAIKSVVSFSIKDTEIINLICNLKNDDITVLGYSVSDFATSALELLGVEKYDGDKQQIIALIESGFAF